MFDLMRKYLSAFSVSGRESELRDIIMKDLAPYADDMTVDAMGNLIVFKKGADSSKKLMTASHMDEIGFMVVAIEDNGMLRVAPVGGINPLASCYHTVRFASGVNGVLVIEDGTKLVDVTNGRLFVDIGASSAAKAKRRVSVGDLCAVAPLVRKLGGSRIAAKAHDDRVCCAINAYAAMHCGKPKYDTYFVFTVQEEVGCRGAKPSSFAVMPDYSIALDVTPAPAVGNPNHLTVTLGGGAAIKIKDSSVICSSAVVDRLTELAKENDIPYQYEVLLAGGTDTSQMQIAGAGSAVCCISLPTRYVHTPVETVDAGDMKACADLLTAFIKQGM